MKLDLVYTFVDNTDEKWLSKYHRYYPYKDSLRHNCNYEITLSLKTVERYFSWVNRIYIVTDQQQFCLNEFGQEFKSKIQFVDHSEIIPAEFLPCFNSAAIELFLHKIKGIEETFVYLNDDIFFGSELNEKDFFSQGKIKQYFNLKYSSPYAKGTNQDYGCIYDSSFDLFHSRWPKTATLFPVNGHMAHILKKKVCSSVWEQFEKELLRTAALKIRTDDCWSEQRNSFSFLTLNAFEAYRKNIGVFCSDIGPVFQDLGHKEYLYLMNNKPKMFCINNITNVNLWNLFRRGYFHTQKIYL